MISKLNRITVVYDMLRPFYITSVLDRFFLVKKLINFASPEIVYLWLGLFASCCLYLGTVRPSWPYVASSR